MMDGLGGMKCKYTIEFDGESHAMDNVVVQRVENPVRGPTARGNVYVAEPQSYRVYGVVDEGISAALSNTMLGPSPDYGGVSVVARCDSGVVRIRGSILSMSRTGGRARLSVAVIDVSGDL